MRRRSSDGWYDTDYSRRRGMSGTTVAAAALVGFAGGIALGTMISQPGGHAYYYHQVQFIDMYGGVHPAGYYSATGFHYPNAAAIAYCPPSGAPDYAAGCGGAQPHHQSHIWMYMLLGCLSCCCIAFLIGYCCSQRKDRRDSGLSVELNESFESSAPPYGDPITRQGQKVPRADAAAFLQAVEAEYVYGAQGEVGRIFESRSILQEVQDRLDCEEEAIRMAGNARHAVDQLAGRWGMTDQLNAS